MNKKSLYLLREESVKRSIRSGYVLQTGHHLKATGLMFRPLFLCQGRFIPRYPPIRDITVVTLLRAGAENLDVKLLKCWVALFR